MANVSLPIQHKHFLVAAAADNVLEENEDPFEWFQQRSSQSSVAYMEQDSYFQQQDGDRNIKRRKSDRSPSSLKGSDLPERPFKSEEGVNCFKLTEPCGCLSGTGFREVAKRPSRPWLWQKELSIKNFDPESISVKVKDNGINIEGMQELTYGDTDGAVEVMKMGRHVSVPQDVDLSKLSVLVQSTGVLLLEAPRHTPDLREAPVLLLENMCLEDIERDACGTPISPLPELFPMGEDRLAGDGSTESGQINLVRLNKSHTARNADDAYAEDLCRTQFSDSALNTIDLDSETIESQDMDT